MSSKDDLKSSRASFLGLLRRKLARELDSMGYPGGHLEMEAGGGREHLMGAVVDAGKGIDRKEHDPMRRHVLQR